MDINDTKQFLALRSKLWDEYHALEKELEELDDRRTDVEARRFKLENILNGYTTDIEDEPTPKPEPKKRTRKPAVKKPVVKKTAVKPRGSQHNPNPEKVATALVQFLTENPGSMRKQIDEALTAAGFTRYEIDKSLKRLRTNGVITNHGSTRQTQWHVVV